MSYWTQLLGMAFAVELFDAGGTRTRVMTAGQGDPIIGLHGLTGHLEGFLPAVPTLAQSHSLHLLDMLGHGYTDKYAGDMKVSIMADHVLRYMDARGIDKAHLMGLSVGGWVSSWLLAHHPDRCLSSILISSAGNPSMERFDILDILQKTTLPGVFSDDREFVFQRLQTVIHKPESIDDELVDVRYAIYHQDEFRANIDSLLAVAKPDHIRAQKLTPEILQRIEQEVLVVWGEDDPTLTLADGQYFNDHIKRSKLVQMSETGHWPPYERPADFAAVTQAFLRGGLDAVSAGRI